MINKFLGFVLLVFFSFSNVLLADNNSDESKVVFTKTRAGEIASNIQVQSRFNELNQPLKRIYEEGVKYLKSDDIKNSKIKLLSEQVYKDNTNPISRDLAYEVLLYEIGHNIINTINKEYGDDALKKYYPKEFLNNISRIPVFLTKQNIDSLIEYASKNVKEGERVSVREAYKDKLPIIEDLDLSGVDLSQLSLDDVPIWNSDFSKTKFTENAICTCSDISLASADISGSTLYRCKECDIRHEIAKTKTETRQLLDCKSVTAERTKFSLDRINTGVSNFSYADLRNSHWSGDLRVMGSNFDYADFSGAIIDRVSCNECSFNKVKLDAIKILGYLNLIKASIDDDEVMNLVDNKKIYFSTRAYAEIPKYSKQNKKRHDIVLIGLKYKYDLSGMDLSNRFLSITSNENVIWDNASFANTVLEDSVIYNSEMSETNFSGVKFLNSDIIG
ncbi:MAG: pentapeptide repeat-containing protein, partial [Rickettsiales bacterium]|nr:pentapeptide repeat-containing protein [Rickettsiales bacterium]